MGREDGGARGLEHVVDGLVGDVRDVHHHPDAVHLPDDGAAEIAEPVVETIGLGVEAGREEVARGVGPAVGVRVGEGHVAHAQAVEAAEGAQRVLDRVAPLDAHEDRDLALPLRATDLGHRRRGHEVGGVGGHDVLDHVDAVEGDPRRAAVGIGRGHVDREEEAGEAALLRPRDVEVLGGAPDHDVGPLLGEGVGHVLVGVDDD